MIRGLEVEALGGAPGIYSARYAGKNATDEQNVEKLLSELREPARKLSAKGAVSLRDRASARWQIARHIQRRGRRNNCR
jgi:Xanthosine triphosphate pyrophosphatase